MEVAKGGRLHTALHNPRFLNVLTAGVMVALGILYIGQVNAAVVKGNMLDELGSANHALQQEHERLEAEIARLRSLESVRSRQAFLGLTKIHDVQYVTATQDVVALR